MFDEDIDKLQSEIDHLNDLCDDANGRPQTENEHLGILILKAQDGDLDKQGFRQLERRLTGNKHALTYYIDFQWLTAMLSEEVGSPRINQLRDAIFGHSTHSL